MERHIPASIYESVPCSLVALRIAADHYRLLAEIRKEEFERKDDFCRILGIWEVDVVFLNYLQ